MDGIEQKSRVDFLRWGAVVLVVIAGLVLVGGGIFVYQKALRKKETTPTTPTPTLQPSEAITEVPETTPTPEIELKRSGFKIKVLNGTGVPGTAGKAAQFLEKLGYEGIKTGNADSFGYEKTIIQIKESKKDSLGMLKEDLLKNYSLSEDIKTLAEEENFDAIVILGKD